MTSKTIKISEENYKWLLKISADIQKKKEEIVSFDGALSELRGEKMKRRKLSTLAGGWKLNKEEAEKLIKEIYKEREIISRRL